MPYLDLDRMADSSKLFVGFSDVTTLHLALNRRGLPTVHGPMALSLSVDRADWVKESLRRVLRGDLRVPKEAPRGKSLHLGRGGGILSPGRKAEGIVTGGNLKALKNLDAAQKEKLKARFSGMSEAEKAKLKEKYKAMMGR